MVWSWAGFFQPEITKKNFDPARPEKCSPLLKNRFRILDSKPFHPYNTQFKLILAYYVLHNWRYGHDRLVPNFEQWTPHPLDEAIPNDVVMENAILSAMMDSYAAQMWQNRGSGRN
jgi:hypothetical protein